MLIQNADATRGHECDACHVNNAPMVNTVTGGFYCNDLCNRRDTVKLHAAFPAMLREAVKLGWPTHYRRDLTLHDRRDLARHEDSEPCIWFIRAWGTHLVYPLSQAVPTNARAPFSPAPLAAIVNAIERTFDDNATRVYTWDGRQLAETTFAGAIEAGNRWARDAHAARRIAA